MAMISATVTTRHVQLDKLFPECLLLLAKLFQITVILINNNDSNESEIADMLTPLFEDSEVYRPVNELYYWPLALALLLSLLVAVISAMPFRSLLRFSSRSEGARHA